MNTKAALPVLEKSPQFTAGSRSGAGTAANIFRLFSETAPLIQQDFDPWQRRPARVYVAVAK